MTEPNPDFKSEREPKFGAASDLRAEPLASGAHRPGQVSESGPDQVSNEADAADRADLDAPGGKAEMEDEFAAAPSPAGDPDASPADFGEPRQEQKPQDDGQTRSLAQDDPAHTGESADSSAENCTSDSAAPALRLSALAFLIAVLKRISSCTALRTALRLPGAILTFVLSGLKKLTGLKGQTSGRRRPHLRRTLQLIERSLPCFSLPALLEEYAAVRALRGTPFARISFRLYFMALLFLVLLSSILMGPLTLVQVCAVLMLLYLNLPMIKGAAEAGRRLSLRLYDPFKEPLTLEGLKQSLGRMYARERQLNEGEAQALSALLSKSAEVPLESFEEQDQRIIYEALSSFNLLGRGFAWTREDREKLQYLLELNAADKAYLREAVKKSGSDLIHLLGEGREQILSLEPSMLSLHTCIFGATGSGKTQYLLLQITQAILRNEAVVIIDPKSDAALLEKIPKICKACGRGADYRLVDLYDTARSEAFNPLRLAGRDIEYAERLTASLPNDGQSGSFRAYAQSAIFAAVCLLRLEEQKITIKAITSIVAVHQEFKERLISYLRTLVRRIGDQSLTIYASRVFGGLGPTTAPAADEEAAGGEGQEQNPKSQENQDREQKQAAQGAQDGENSGSQGDQDQNQKADPKPLKAAPNLKGDEAQAPEGSRSGESANRPQDPESVQDGSTGYSQDGRKADKESLGADKNGKKTGKRGPQDAKEEESLDAALQPEAGKKRRAAKAKAAEEKPASKDNAKDLPPEDQAPPEDKGQDPESKEQPPLKDKDEKSRPKDSAKSTKGAAARKGRTSSKTSKDKGSSSPAAKSGEAIKAGTIKQFYRYMIDRGYIAEDERINQVLSIICLEPAYYYKVSRAALPLLEKLSTGDLKELFSREGHMMSASSAIEGSLVLQISLRCLIDSSLGSEIGKLVLDEIRSYAGRFAVLKAAGKITASRRVNIFIDEAAEVVNESLIQLLNKSRSAGFAITLATQTAADLEVRTGKRGTMQQILGNCNTLVTLRVFDKETASLLEESFGRSLIRRHSSTRSFFEGPFDISYSGSKSESETEVPAVSSELLNRLPPLEFMCRLPSSQLVKGRVPFLEV